MEKIGIIDLGSNNARLVIVEMLGDGHFIVVDQIKESVRLGKDMERDGFLKPQRIAETMRTLKMFRKLCDAYGIEKIIAVATAAVRRAKNQRSFLDEVATTCGIKFRVLTAEEEAVYVYRGVINTMDIPKGVILEIGGGSTKIVRYVRKNLLNYETLPFGAVTLTELFAQDGLRPEEQAAKVEEFFVEQLKRIEWLKELDPETQLIGVGGSFRSLCKLCKLMKKSPLNNVHNYRIPVNEFDNVYNMIKVLDLDKKKRIKGISSERSCGDFGVRKIRRVRADSHFGLRSSRRNNVQLRYADHYRKTDKRRFNVQFADSRKILQLQSETRRPRGQPFCATLQAVKGSA